MIINYWVLNTYSSFKNSNVLFVRYSYLKFLLLLYWIPPNRKFFSCLTIIYFVDTNDHTDNTNVNTPTTTNQTAIIFVAKLPFRLKLN